MSFHRNVAMCSVCAVVLTTAALSAPRPERMFPTFVMFRGGALKEPVLLTHSNVTIVTVNGRQMANIEKDPLAIVYGTLERTTRVPPDVPDIVTTYEVAEFFGSGWSSVAGPDGKPTRKLQFEEASNFSRIRVLRSGPPIWMHPVVAPGGGDYSGLVISDTAQALLAQIGLKLR